MMSSKNIFAMVAAAFMLLLSQGATAQEAPSIQEIQAELQSLRDKGGKAAQVAKDFMNSSCMNQLKSGLKTTGKNAKAAKNACKDYKSCKKNCKKSAKKVRKKAKKSYKKCRKSCGKKKCKKIKKKGKKKKCKKKAKKCLKKCKKKAKKAGGLGIQLFGNKKTRKAKKTCNKKCKKRFKKKCSKARAKLWKGIGEGLVGLFKNADCKRQAQEVADTAKKIGKETKACIKSCGPKCAKCDRGDADCKKTRRACVAKRANCVKGCAEGGLDTFNAHGQAELDEAVEEAAEAEEAAAVEAAVEEEEDGDWDDDEE